MRSFFRFEGNSRLCVNATSCPGDKSNVGVVVGVVVGTVAVAIIVALVVVYFFWSARKKRAPLEKIPLQGIYHVHSTSSQELQSLKVRFHRMRYKHCRY